MRDLLIFAAGVFFGAFVGAAAYNQFLLSYENKLSKARID